MVFSESPDKTTYTVSIPGILDERTIILRRDASGKPLSNVTAMDTWSNTERYADNELYKKPRPGAPQRVGPRDFSGRWTRNNSR